MNGKIFALLIAALAVASIASALYFGGYLKSIYGGFTFGPGCSCAYSGNPTGSYSGIGYPGTSLAIQGPAINTNPASYIVRFYKYSNLTGYIGSVSVPNQYVYEASEVNGTTTSYQTITDYWIGITTLMPMIGYAQLPTTTTKYIDIYAVLNDTANPTTGESGFAQVNIWNYSGEFMGDTREPYLINSVTSFTPPTTTSSTTTILTSSQSPPISQPPAFSYAGLLSVINGFVSYLKSLWTSYFATPITLSVGLGPITAQNTSYANVQLTSAISLQIPSNIMSRPWSIGASQLNETFCSAYVFQNSTQAYPYQSAPQNATAPFYNATITFTPSAAGIYVFGGFCKTSTIAFANGAWGAWSAPAITVSQYRAVDVIPSTYSLSNPQTSYPIPTASALYAGFSSFLAGIASAFGSLLRLLGI